MFAFALYLHILNPYINILSGVFITSVSKEYPISHPVEQHLRGRQIQVKTGKMLQIILIPCNYLSPLDTFKASILNLSFQFLQGRYLKLPGLLMLVFTGMNLQTDRERICPSASLLLIYVDGGLITFCCQHLFSFLLEAYLMCRVINNVIPALMASDGTVPSARTPWREKHSSLPSGFHLQALLYLSLILKISKLCLHKSG